MDTGYGLLPVYHGLIFASIIRFYKSSLLEILHAVVRT